MPSQDIIKLIPLIQQYMKDAPIKRAYLFGSCSRGEETPTSDVDLMVTYDDSNHISLLTISHIINELGDLLGRRVDLVEEGRLMPFATYSAEKDKLLIYERTN